MRIDRGKASLPGRTETEAADFGPTTTVPQLNVHHDDIESSQAKCMAAAVKHRSEIRARLSKVSWML